MAISGYLLKNKGEYVLEKTKAHIKIIAEKMNMHINEQPPYVKDGEISYIQYTIYDDVAFNLDEEDWGDDSVGQGKSLGFYVYPLDEKYEYDNTFDCIKEGKNLQIIICIDDMEFKEELVLRFLYEYFQLNPEDYFWNDNKWCYTLRDIERICRLPFDENWGYKNPN